MTSRETPDTIRSLDDLTDLWRVLLAHTPQHGRSLWLIVHDADGHPTKQVVSLEDLPLAPEPSDEENLHRLVRTMQSLSPEPTFVIALLARPGTSRPSAFEQDWARLVLAVSGQAMAWPVCCATPHGVRVLDTVGPA